MKKVRCECGKIVEVGERALGVICADCVIKRLLNPKKYRKQSKRKTPKQLKLLQEDL